MTWFRRSDGSAVISDIVTRPPDARIMALMSHAHGADMHRAWANAVVNGLFAPIPRLYAAGVATLSRHIGADDLDQIDRELGDLIVETLVPSPEHDGFIVVRHEETAAVERALDQILFLAS